MILLGMMDYEPQSMVDTGVYAIMGYIVILHYGPIVVPDFANC